MFIAGFLPMAAVLLAVSATPADQVPGGYAAASGVGATSRTQSIQATKKPLSRLEQLRQQLKQSKE